MPAPLSARTYLRAMTPPPAAAAAAAAADGAAADGGAGATAEVTAETADVVCFMGYLRALAAAYPDEYPSPAAARATAPPPALVHGLIARRLALRAAARVAAEREVMDADDLDEALREILEEANLADMAESEGLAAK